MKTKSIRIIIGSGIDDDEVNMYYPESPGRGCGIMPNELVRNLVQALESVERLVVATCSETVVNYLLNLVTEEVPFIGREDVSVEHEGHVFKLNANGYLDNDESGFHSWPFGLLLWDRDILPSK